MYMIMWNLAGVLCVTGFVINKLQIWQLNKRIRLLEIIIDNMVHNHNEVIIRERLEMSQLDGKNQLKEVH